MQSTGFYTHVLRPGTVCSDRSSALLPLAANRSVLHIGCTDAPLTDARMANGTLLHKQLIGVASDLHGVDVDGRGINSMREALGGSYSICDISTSLPTIPFEPDLILAADVIEHVANQGAFVAGLARLSNRYPGAVVAISTPNALSARTFVNTLCNREIIHPDHCLLHSPTTLHTLLTGQGLHLERFLYYNVTSGHGFARMVYDVIPRFASYLRPGFADGMVALARST